MKQILPLIVAVLLGFVAVIAVDRTLSGQDTAKVETCSVLLVGRNIPKGTLLTAANLTTRTIEKRARPASAIDASAMSNYVDVKKVTRDVMAGDYLLTSDVGNEQSARNPVAAGEWGVPVEFADSSLVRTLKPSDEIAIVGTYTYTTEERNSKDASAGVTLVEHTETAVLYPRVIVADVRGSTVLLSMPPDQAIALTAIQREVRLYPLLRTALDLSNRDGSAIGAFNADAVRNIFEARRRKPIAVGLKTRKE